MTYAEKLEMLYQILEEQLTMAKEKVFCPGGKGASLQGLKNHLLRTAKLIEVIQDVHTAQLDDNEE